MNASRPAGRSGVCRCADRRIAGGGRRNAKAWRYADLCDPGKFATDAFLPALADPYAWIYSKAKLDQDPHWYEKNILGSGPFKFVAYETGQSIKGERNPDYYHKGLPYLDGFLGIYADKQVTRVEAIRSDRAAIEFRGFPPTVRDELKQALGDKITVQASD